MRYFKNTNNKIYAYDATQTPAPGLVEITDEEKDLILRQTELDAFEALSYAEKRQTEYPSIIDYIDGIVKNDQAQIQAYMDRCLAIKAKYPKP